MKKYLITLLLCSSAYANSSNYGGYFFNDTDQTIILTSPSATGFKPGKYSYQTIGPYSYFRLMVTDEAPCPSKGDCSRSNTIDFELQDTINHRTLSKFSFTHNTHNDKEYYDDSGFLTFRSNKGGQSLKCTIYKYDGTIYSDSMRIHYYGDNMMWMRITQTKCISYFD